MLRVIGAAVRSFRADHGRLARAPDELIGDAGYLDTYDTPTDAWGNTFVYRLHDADEFELMSSGADGELGGNADDADIALSTARGELRDTTPSRER